jgi:hypothetical protein
MFVIFTSNTSSHRKDDKYGTNEQRKWERRRRLRDKIERRKKKKIRTQRKKEKSTE